MSVLEAFFGWPSGQVWPNLVASAVTTVLAVGWSHRRLARRMHARHDEHAASVSQLTDLVSALHTRLDADARRKDR